MCDEQLVLIKKMLYYDIWVISFLFWFYFFWGDHS